MSDPYSAFEGRVDVKINEENTSIIYKDSVLYMNWKNHKIAINAQAIIGVISSLSVLSTSFVNMHQYSRSILLLLDKKSVLNHFSHVK